MMKARSDGKVWEMLSDSQPEGADGQTCDADFDMTAAPTIPAPPPTSAVRGVTSGVFERAGDNDALEPASLDHYANENQANTAPTTERTIASCDDDGCDEPPVVLPRPAAVPSFDIPVNPREDVA